jgi:Tol biopolymer transport system component
MKSTVFWKNRFILVGMIVFAMLFISACSGDEYPPPNNNKKEALTFLYDTGETHEVWGMCTDGSGREMLADNPEGYETVQQTSSPDGRYLVYVLHPQGQMVSKDMETGIVTVLVNDGGSSFDPTPSYSYDGTKIVYAMSDGNSDEYGIRVMNADGSNIQVLTTLSDDVSPAFNRDGTKIVFDRGWNGDIMVMNSDGSEEPTLVKAANGSKYGHPQFLPDGRIVCMRKTDDNQDIVVMDADGSNEINLTPDTPDSNEFAPTVNKAGDRIAFSIEDSSGNYDIYVGTFTGTALTDLKNLTADVDYDCWRPRYAIDFVELP